MYNLNNFNITKTLLIISPMIFLKTSFDHNYYRSLLMTKVDTVSPSPPPSPPPLSLSLLLFARLELLRKDVQAGG